MIRFIAACYLAASALYGTVINTNNASTVAAFQAGATVVTFDNISGRTPQTITSYTTGSAVSPAAFIFDQIAGVQMSVGGAVGTNEPALFTLSGAIAGNAHSAPTVLGPVDFDFTTKFGPGAQIEMFFPTKVSRVGFWLNPALGNVTIIAADTNFAFSKQDETTLESGTVNAGNFVGIQRATADIGGFKIIGLGTNGFTIDDLTIAGAGGGGGGGSTVPEPATSLLIGGALLVLSRRRAR